MDQILFLDEHIFRLVNQTLAHPVLDWVMAAVSSPSLLMPLMVSGVVWLLWRGGERGRFLCLVLFLNLAIGDGFINQSLRSVIQRPRPVETVIGARKVGWKGWGPQVKVVQTRVKKPGGRSMPSGHMLNNVSVGVAAAFLFPHIRWGIVLWVVLMGYSRVYTGAHYPTDVLVSVWVGLGYSAVFMAFCHMLYRYAATKWPSLFRGCEDLPFGNGRESQQSPRDSL